MLAGSALQPDADAKRRDAVSGTCLVDRLDDALLLRAQQLQLRQLRRRRARRKPERQNAHSDQGGECAAPPLHAAAVLHIARTTDAIKGALGCSNVYDYRAVCARTIAVSTTKAPNSWEGLSASANQA